MPPNPNDHALELRQRRTVIPNEQNDDRAIQLPELKGHEIAIEGSVFDISEFQHPGGEVVKFFGGNDVSVQYR